jgi:hypothetical protein
MSNNKYRSESTRITTRKNANRFSRTFAFCFAVIFASIFLFSTFYFLFSASVKAAEPLTLKYNFPCSGLPGTTCPSKEEAAASPAAYIARFYQFALALAGMLAFGMIIYGAIQYTVSAGNTARQKDARDRITQALWGVALLLGAWLILYTIDPKLVSLTDPDIGIVEAPAMDWTAEEKAEIEKMKLPLGEQTPIKEGEKDIVKGDGIVEREIGGKLYRDTYQWVKGTSCKRPWFVTAQNECITWGRLTPPFPEEEQSKWRCCQKREKIK